MNESLKHALNVVLSVALMIWGAFVLTIGWGWFVAPKFGLPRLRVPDAIGLAMIVTFFLFPVHLHLAQAEMKRRLQTTDDAVRGILTSLVMGLVVYPVALGVAWVVHLF